MTAQWSSLRWREYGIEAWALGSFMLSACLFGALVFYPGSPVARMLPSPIAQRAVMGVFMGLTLIALVYSPWGRRSGAQMNPAFTITFWGLGRISTVDAVGYVAAQFLGGTLGVWIAASIAGMALQHPQVRYVVTQPGPAGMWAAFAAEVVIAFLQMQLVLHVSSSTRWRRFTGVAAALGVALYITVEAPISGMSMNPARSVASAIAAHSWTAIWLYFAAPVVGMVLAAAAFIRQQGANALPCGKMMHATPCLFCDYVAKRSAVTYPQTVAASERRQQA